MLNNSVVSKAVRFALISGATTAAFTAPVAFAAEGDEVFLDHTEIWTFVRGETAQHRFVTMHEMKDGKVYRWSDFWDMNKFVSQFPAWFLEEMTKSSADDFS